MRDPMPGGLWWIAGWHLLIWGSAGGGIGSTPFILETAGSNTISPATMPGAIGIGWCRRSTPTWPMMPLPGCSWRATSFLGNLRASLRRVFWSLGRTIPPSHRTMACARRCDRTRWKIWWLVSQTFLGMTTHCARCHDHKFDPISSRDYYRMAASLAGVEFGERVLPSGSEGSPGEEKPGP